LFDNHFLGQGEAAYPTRWCYVFALSDLQRLLDRAAQDARRTGSKGHHVVGDLPAEDALVRVREPGYNIVGRALVSVNMTV
jgi:hypothetical protein